MANPEENSNRQQPAAEPLRVMLVGESEVVGERVHEVLDGLSDITVSVRVADGIGAVSAMRRQVVDAVILDIGDPQMNVSVTLSRLFRVDPQAKVVMVASLSFGNVKNSMRGLMEGAAEFIPTPAAHAKTHSEPEFANKLTSVIRAFGRSERSIAPRTVVTRRAPPRPRAAEPKQPAPITLRPAARLAPKVLAVGSSTGGPQALFTFLATMPPSLDLPIFITQHMPATFTSLLANHISKHSGLDCREGEDGEPVRANRLYLAPGDLHMTVERVDGTPTIRLNDGPQINFCRPAVDPLFESVSQVYGDRVLATVLTGMGSDGLAGGRAVVEAGGTVIAQDEESCVVWGMPRAVAEAGLCSAILPLDELGPFVGKFITDLAAG